MRKPTLSGIERLKTFFAPLKDESLNKDQQNMISEKINLFRSEILKEFAYGNIPHISECAAEILLSRSQITESEYINILESL